MSATDISLEEMLSACAADAQAAADAAFDDYVPPPGTYTATCSLGTRSMWNNDQGQKVAIQRVKFAILDGPEAGKSYDKALWSSSTVDQGVIRQLAALLNGGKKTKNWAENMRTIVSKAPNSVVQFEMEYKPNKTAGGEPYKNIKFTNLLSAGSGS